MNCFSIGFNVVLIRKMKIKNCYNLCRLFLSKTENSIGTLRKIRKCEIQQQIC